MFKNTKAFSGFAVDDLAVAKKFYGETLGIEVEQGGQGLRLKIAGGNATFVYSKPDHVPATYTILNFPVDDIDRAVDQLTAAGVKFEHYGKLTDARGIARGAATGGGPDIAWFKDPAGNILSVLQES
jgi:predicted enzyme related to lactoylglutathione lyase